MSNHTLPEFLEKIHKEISSNDLRTDILLTHLWAERLMEGIIIQKFKNHTEINKFDFSRKRKIIFGLELIQDDWNYDLKILNDIRVEYAHEIYPQNDKIFKLIKKFKSYPDEKECNENGLKNEMMKFGFLIIILLAHLLDIFWDINSKNK